MLTAPAMGRPDPVVLSTMTPEFCAVTTTGGGSAVHPTAAKAYFYPVRLTQPRTYTKAWWLNGATAAGNVDVGIYTVSGTTATRIVASTAEAQGTISVMQVAGTFTTTTIGPGLYYIALSASLGTATFVRAQVGIIHARGLGVFEAATAHPLPSSITVTQILTTYGPAFGFSERSTV